MSISRSELIHNAVRDGGNEKSRISGFYPNSSGGFGSTLAANDPRVQYKVEVYNITNEELQTVIDIIEADERVDNAYITRECGYLRVNFKETYAAEQLRIKVDSKAKGFCDDDSRIGKEFMSYGSHYKVIAIDMTDASFPLVVKQVVKGMVCSKLGQFAQNALDTGEIV